MIYVVKIGDSGRVASGSAEARTALAEAAKYAEASVRELARLALRRTEQAPIIGRRLHLSPADRTLFAEPNGASASSKLPAGAAVMSLHWNIPSSTNEEGPRGGLEYFDHVQIDIQLL